jgi:DNA invertase Pin-like site-specific DNA recombinase
MNGTPNAIVYCRVSTTEQADHGISLDAQKAKAKAWCIANDYSIASIQIDAGISGKRADNRPALQAALNEACAHKGALIVYSLSRLARSTRDAIEIAERLGKAGADLVSLSEHIDTTTAAGKMVFRMLAVLAEFERDQIAERTSTAMRHKASRGEYTGGHAPYGYRVENGRLVANRGEQEIISTARQLRRVKGLGLKRIARQLNEAGHRSRTGRPFQAVQVRGMIREESNGSERRIQAA